MRKAFTLLELLVVVSIMGMMGVAATGAYGVLVSGMRDRGTCAAASAVLRAAKERAKVDRVRTVVYCYNKCLRKPISEDDAGIVAGCMTAVRIAGRITRVNGDFLYDEFADLDGCYERTTEDDAAAWQRRKSHLLYKFSGGDDSTTMRYSEVSDTVFQDWDTQQEVLFSGAAQNGKTNILTSAFYVCQNQSGKGIGVSQWKVGDGYGLVFAELQLPDGYIFGGNVPTMTAGELVIANPVFEFEPGNTDNNKSIEIYRTQPNERGVPQKDKKAGEAKADETKSV